MVKFKHSDLLVAYKNKLMQVERSHGNIVFLKSPNGYYGITKDLAKRLLVRKALNIDLGFKLEPIR